MAESLIQRPSVLWQYLLPQQRQMVEDGEKLIEDAKLHPKKLTDYSYIVFPLARVYEGFLKKLLLDLGLIHEQQYRSEHFRIGKVLNPNLPDHLKIEGLYDRICSQSGGEVAERFWQTWKKGRNLLFHYFPGKLQKISLDQAVEIVREIVATMTAAVTTCRIPERKSL